MISINDLVTKFIMINTVAGIGYFTAVIQDIVIIRLLNNVKLNLFSLVLQSSIFIVSILLLIMNINLPHNDALTNVCAPYLDLTQD